MSNTKQELIKKYKRYYRSYHGVVPKGINISDWTNNELQIGIDALNLAITKHISRSYQESIHLRG